ncbi:MAG: hypothetical protein SOU48_05460 [Prevotella sp.]|nr:hypothetical protein [Prevotella sp.]
MKKKNYITPNLIIVSIATDSLVLAGSGGGPQSVNNCMGDGNQLGKYGSFADDDDNDMEWDW